MRRKKNGLCQAHRCSVVPQGSPVAAFHPGLRLYPIRRPISPQTGIRQLRPSVAGATGTGKTVTLQVMAEGFSRIGVPVFMADVKGDLAGIASRARVAAS